jgi:uncharacterized membrane protein
MKNKNWIFNGIIIAFTVFFIASAVIFNVFEIEILPAQFYGALIGVFITAIVTAFLLRGQTEGNEKRDKNVKIFEKKQELCKPIYYVNIKIKNDFRKLLLWNIQKGFWRNQIDG